jgi:hypothetical protein
MEKSETNRPILTLTEEKHMFLPFCCNRSQVQGSTFRVKDKEGSLKTRSSG